MPLLVSADEGIADRQIADLTEQVVTTYCIAADQSPGPSSQRTQ